MLENFEFNLVDNQINVNNQRTVSHQFGQALVSPNSEFCYINIPKNASSTMSLMFRNWKPVDFRELDSSVIFLVVLRDPTERWISAVAEFLVGHNGLGRITQLTAHGVQQVLDSELIKNWIFKTVYLDAHSLPQCFFLQGLNINQTKFFYQDKELTRKLSKYTGVSLVDNQNIAESNPLKALVSDHLTKLIAHNAELAKTINIHYWADHQLFDNVRFEN